jgi:hypothetical protein
MTNREKAKAVEVALSGLAGCIDCKVLFEPTYQLVTAAAGPLHVRCNNCQTELIKKHQECRLCQTSMHYYSCIDFPDGTFTCIPCFNKERRNA